MKRALIDYVNWKGERSLRLILPDAISFGSTKWHPKPQWLLRAFDVRKGEWRHFAMSDIKSWRQEEETEEP